MNYLKEALNIQYPIIQGGMIWCSGWELASEVSNSGGLGVIGAGSMTPEVLIEHIKKCKNACSKSFGINIPLMYRNADKHVDIAIKNKIKVVITSAGNPSKYTKILKDNGVKVFHLVSNLKFALKAEMAGVDAIIAEGYEAGGHNGIEENTTMTLIPFLTKHLKIPIIAAGGIASGRAIVASMALGAVGVQIGSLFVTAEESSAHDNFKRMIIDTKENNTKVVFKSTIPVRLLKNDFFDKAICVDKMNDINEVKALNKKGLAKLGMFEGNITSGKLEIGQVVGQIDKIKPANQIFHELIEESNQVFNSLKMKSKAFQSI